MKIHTEVLSFIELVRESVPNAVNIYTEGNCTSFARMLEITFPGGQVLHNMDHACYEYGVHYYDITGEIKKPRGSKPIEEYGIRAIMELTKNNYAR